RPLRDMEGVWRQRFGPCRNDQDKRQYGCRSGKCLNPGENQRHPAKLTRNGICYSLAARNYAASPGFPTMRPELPAGFASDHVHACQMMTRVHTVSIVAKNRYSTKAGGLPNPSRGATNVAKPFIRVKTPAAMIFASRFALNGSSRDARIMAMG